MEQAKKHDDEDSNRHGLACKCAVPTEAGTDPSNITVGIEQKRDGESNDEKRQKMLEVYNMGASSHHNRIISMHMWISALV